MTKQDAQLIPDMSMMDYVNDPCPAPSVNTSVIKGMLNKSPAHVFAEHNRLGNTIPYNPSKAAEIGSAAHSYVLGGAESIWWIDADSYRTKDAKEQRESAHDAGLIPMLEKDREVIETLGSRAKEALLRIAPETEWLFEHTMIWHDADGTWHRARPDAICTTKPIIIDLKFTGIATPHQWMKNTMYDNGYDLQAAHGEAGADACGIWPKQYFFLVVEQNAPYCVFPLVGIREDARNFAELARERAVQMFAECLKTGKWDGYEFKTVFAEPSWSVKARHDRLFGEAG